MMRGVLVLGFLASLLLTSCRSLPPAAAGEERSSSPSVAGTAATEGRLEVDAGIELYYRVIGSGSDTLIVANAAQAPDLSALARSRRVVTYDVRGRGRSARYQEDLEVSLERDIADLEALRTHLGSERVSLLGSSYFAGMMALYAASHPVHVERLVMVAPISASVKTYSQAQPSAADSERQLLVELMSEGSGGVAPADYCREYYRLTWPRLLGDRSLASSMSNDFCDLPNEWPPSLLAWTARIFTSIGIWDWSSRAAAVAAPVLVVQGDRDRIVPPAGAQEWVEIFPEARLLSVAGVGHVPLHERPEELLPQIDRFLSGDWPRQAAVP